MRMFNPHNTPMKEMLLILILCIGIGLGEKKKPDKFSKASVRWAGLRTQSWCQRESVQSCHSRYGLAPGEGASAARKAVTQAFPGLTYFQSLFWEDSQVGSCTYWSLRWTGLHHHLEKFITLYLYTRIHRSVIHNSQQLTAIQVSIKG